MSRTYSPKEQFNLDSSVESNPSANFNKLYPDLNGKFINHTSDGAKRQLGHVDDGTSADIPVWNSTEQKYMPLTPNNRDEVLTTSLGIEGVFWAPADFHSHWKKPITAEVNYVKQTPGLPTGTGTDGERGINIVDQTIFWYSSGWHSSPLTVFSVDYRVIHSLAGTDYTMDASEWAPDYVVWEFLNPWTGFASYTLKEGSVFLLGSTPYNSIVPYQQYIYYSGLITPFNNIANGTEHGQVAYWSGELNRYIPLDIPSTDGDSFLISTKITNIPTILSWGKIDAAYIGLGNVEDVALSTWTGTTNINYIGTLETDVLMTGSDNRNIGITASTSIGRNLTIYASRPVNGGTDLNGGDLMLKSGISTGSGTSAIRLYTATAGSSGSADATPTEKMTILGNGNVGINSINPTYKFEVHNNSDNNIAKFQGISSSINITGNGSIAKLQNANGELQLQSGGNKMSFIANNNFMTLAANGHLFLSESTGSQIDVGIITINANSDQTIGMRRNDTTNGNSLTIKSGDAFSSGSNLNGGPIILKPGISTGNGTSYIGFYGLPGIAASGTSDNTPTLQMFFKPGTSTGTRSALVIGTNNTASYPTSSHILEVVSGSAAADNFYTPGTSGAYNISNGGVSQWTQNAFYLNSNANGSIYIRRATTNAGKDLSILGGSAQASSTDQNGGNLILSSGTPTGTGSSMIKMYLPQTSTVAGTADNNPIDTFSVERTSTSTNIRMRHTGTVQLIANTDAGALNTLSIFYSNLYGSNGFAVQTNNGYIGSTNANYIFGIGTTPDGNHTLQFNGDSNRTIGLKRNTTTSGSNLIINAGSALAGGTDLNSGDLILKSGISTGTGTGNLRFYTTSAGSSGTSDNTATEKLSLLSTGDLVLGKTSGIGIKVDIASPSFGYRDLIGQIVPHVGGGTAPTSTLIRGTGTHIKGWSFTANQVIDDITYHIPHDYVPGSDLYFHVHWEHSGTAISGSFVITWYVTYSKGYNQASHTFIAEKTITQTITTSNITAYPQYGHFIEEFQLSNNGGDSTHLNTADIEIDGLVKVAAVITTIPTITGAPGGSANTPFILTADIHYQSTNIGTKNKNINFYN